MRIRTCDFFYRAPVMASPRKGMTYHHRGAQPDIVAEACIGLLPKVSRVPHERSIIEYLIHCVRYLRARCCRGYICARRCGLSRLRCRRSRQSPLLRLRLSTWTPPTLHIKPLTMRAPWSLFITFHFATPGHWSVFAPDPRSGVVLTCRSRNLPASANTVAQIPHCVPGQL